jgi:hypothetical protein
MMVMDGPKKPPYPSKRTYATLERDDNGLPVIVISHMEPEHADFIWGYMVLNKEPGCWMTPGLVLRSKAGAHLGTFDRHTGEARITLHGSGTMDDFLLYLRDASGLVVHR